MLLGAVPRHIQTADYWAGYSGTKTVSPESAATALSWVETDAPGSARISRFGVKTIMYTNPNRVMPGQSILYTPDESDDRYARTCGGQAARGESGHRGILLTNPRSESLANAWRKSVDAHARGGHFDAIFADDAVGAASSQDVPCGYDLDDWVSAEQQLFRKLNLPVIYNGLNDFSNHGIAREIQLNGVAAGGMMEECYAERRGDHRVGGWKWIATEATELQMAHDRKYFFCYGRDTSPAQSAYDSRLYTYASVLLTYDPRTTVLWEYYKTPSNGHVMPESQVVAFDPVRPNVTRINDLRTSARRVRARVSRLLHRRHTPGPVRCQQLIPTILHTVFRWAGTAAFFRFKDRGSLTVERFRCNAGCPDHFQRAARSSPSNSASARPYRSESLSKHRSAEPGNLHLAAHSSASRSRTRN